MPSGATRIVPRTRDELTLDLCRSGRNHRPNLRAWAARRAFLMRAIRERRERPRRVAANRLSAGSTSTVDPRSRRGPLARAEIRRSGGAARRNVMAKTKAATIAVAAT